MALALADGLVCTWTLALCPSLSTLSLCPVHGALQAEATALSMTTALCLSNLKASFLM